MIDIRCTCGETYHAEEAFSGQKIKCRNCGTILIIQKQVPSITPDPNVRTDYRKPEHYSPPSSKFNYPITPKKSSLNKKNIKRILLLSAIVIVIAGFIFLIRTIPSNNTYSNRPESGNIYPDPADTIQTAVDPYADWDKVNLHTGKSPACLNFKSTYDYTINNKLEVSVGSNTDVVLKLCSLLSGKCIRYIYIRSDDTYIIRNIPQGKYYTKIAYGQDWRQKIINGKCIGKFVKNALYKKGDQILDYYIKDEGSTYSVPSYSLSLSVVLTDFDPKIYHTDVISEEEFNR